MDLGQAMWEVNFSQRTFIGTQVLPIFSTPKRAANFSRITKESISRKRNVKRAARSAYSRDEFEAKDQGYSCKERGHEQPLDDGERELYASDFAAEQAASRIAMQVVLQEQERDIAATVFNPSLFTGSSYNDVSGTPWATASTDIIGQIKTSAKSVRLNCANAANALIISQSVLDNQIGNNTAIASKLQYTQVPTQDAIIKALGGLFNLKHIIVGNVVDNTANEGQAFLGGDMWGTSYAMVARICETNDLTEPGLGRTMLWSADSAENALVEEYREEQTRSWIYRCRHHVDEVIFDIAFGQLLKIN
jgi:hypothetical protein